MDKQRAIRQTKANSASVSRRDAAMPPTPFVSVIIPVYNDVKRLEICLRALQSQDYPKDRYEVIVVDNGSHNDIHPIMQKFRSLKVRLVQELRVGSYAARNRGVSVSRDGVLAFTDSDCIPSRNWIGKGAENLSKVPNPGLVAGRVQVFYREPERPTPVELYDQMFNLRADEGKPVTANMFTLKRVFEKVGLFDSTLKSRGDLEWARRVHLAGYRLQYAADLWVSHPARFSFGQIYRKAIRVEGGVHDSCRKYANSLASSIKGSPYRILRDIIAVWLQRDWEWSQRLKVLIVMFSVRWVGILERLRLGLGGDSRR